MKILTDLQIKEADRYTIQNEPISSIDLMERASMNIALWIDKHIAKEHPLLFLIGKGNNGGDGLAAARILYEKGFKCSLFLAFTEEYLSEESKFNFKRLPTNINILDTISVSRETIIIDALLGTGVKGAVKDPILSIIKEVNSLPNEVISIDLPSGMISEFGNEDQVIIKASTTLTLEFPKLAMLLPEAGNFCGNIEIIPIQLHKGFINDSDSPFYYTTEKLAKTLTLKRDKFAHKGTYGHALLICGSTGMMGAAVLATGAALRSGCGLVTVHTPKEERAIIHTTHPSAIVSLDEEEYFSSFPEDLSKYTTIGIGPGLGQNTETAKAFESLLKRYSKPMVIDADALNILANNYRFRHHIPEGSILTPHLGELERLVGKWDNEQHKLKLARRLASNTKSIVIVKGAHTMICTPDGKYYFNSTGNSGMAKGGSGDILTGFITGLLARGYSSLHAAILSTYLHGVAGDKAAIKLGEESMNSSDIINELKIQA